MDYSDRLLGVYGETNSATDWAAGLYGLAKAATGATNGVFGQTNSTAPYAAGLFGRAAGATGATDGVYGETRSTSNGAAGVWGVAAGGSGSTFGVYGQVWSPNGHALHASCTDPNAYGLYVAQGKAYFNGYVEFGGGHSDLAENYHSRGVEPGDVVVIGPDGVLVRCAHEADSRVAGIVSTDPAMKLGVTPRDGHDDVPVALAGRVPCKVEATRRPIRPGDLLVTSGTPGYAMRAPNDHPKAGTVIGKALQGLGSGMGVIQVLVTLR